MRCLGHLRPTLRSICSRTLQLRACAREGIGHRAPFCSALPQTPCRFDSRWSSTAVLLHRSRRRCCTAAAQRLKPCVWWNCLWCSGPTFGRSHECHGQRAAAHSRARVERETMLYGTPSDAASNIRPGARVEKWSACVCTNKREGVGVYDWVRVRVLKLKCFIVCAHMSQVRAERAEGAG